MTRAALVASVVAGAMLAATAGRAADFTVHNGETTGQQTLSGANAIGTIETGGAIITSGDNTPGVVSGDPYNTINNDGTVSTDGAHSYGIDAYGDHASVTNGGTINGSGDTWIGINSAGDNAFIDNSGLIEGSGQFAAGIFSLNDYATIINRGTITTSANLPDDRPGGISSEGNYATIENLGSITATGYEANGIASAFNDHATITNSGSIHVSGDQSTGVNIAGGSPEVTNVGTITTSGEFSTAIFSNSDDAVIVNRGEITTWDDYSEGIYVNSGDGAVVINSGKVFTNGVDTWAIDMEGTNSTLDLLAGTVLQGGLYYLNADTATLNIGTGLNTAFTFNTLARDDQHQRPALRDRRRRPCGRRSDRACRGQQLRARPRPLDRRCHRGPRAGGCQRADDRRIARSDERRRAWAVGDRASASTATHQASGSLEGYHYGAGGVMLGIDRTLSAATAAGVFGGFSDGKIATAADSTHIGAAGAFAGAYWNRDDGKSFAHVSLTGGGLDNDSDRTVANNLVAGGLETAHASYGSYYVSPALTFGLHQAAGDATVSPSLGVR
ncbi:MAG: autotransporter outer membrane beta-barrel domain-containing protein [Bauldia sp.]